MGHLLCSGCFAQTSLILMSMQQSSCYYPPIVQMRKLKLNDLPKITELLSDREGNQFQVCQALKHTFLPLFNLASAVVIVLEVWLP